MDIGNCSTMHDRKQQILLAWLECTTWVTMGETSAVVTSQTVLPNGVMLCSFYNAVFVNAIYFVTENVF
jgi:hypothetical protein